jgi:hypothetical protein
MKAQYPVDPATVKIESDVPLPLRSSAARATKYPFGTMKLGDSFAIPTNGGVDKAKTHLRTVAQTFGRHNPDFAFTLRQVIEQGEVKVRIWRVVKEG